MTLKKLFAGRSSIQNSNKTVTSAATLTLRQSLWPLTIVTILFFLWVSSILCLKGELIDNFRRVSRMVCLTP